MNAFRFPDASWEKEPAFASLVSPKDSFVLYVFGAAKTFCGVGGGFRGLRMASDSLVPAVGGMDLVSRTFMVGAGESDGCAGMAPRSKSSRNTYVPTDRPGFS